MKTQSDTSRLSYEKIMRPGARETHHRSIILALEWIIDGTSWEIAKQAKIKPDQVWKRMNEMVSAGIVIDTGLRRNSPDGNPAIVYALVEWKEKYADIPKPEGYQTGQTTAADFASMLIEGSATNKKKKYVEQVLFPDLK